MGGGGERSASRDGWSARRCRDPRLKTLYDTKLVGVQALVTEIDSSPFVSFLPSVECVIFSSLVENALLWFAWMKHVPQGGNGSGRTARLGALM